MCVGDGVVIDDDVAMSCLLGSGYGNDMEFVGVCFDFPLFFKSVDVCDGSLCGEGAVIWVEMIGDNLGDVVGVCNVVCVVLWMGRGDVAGVVIE